MPSDTPTSETSLSNVWAHRLRLGGSKMVGIVRGLASAAADRFTKKLFLAAYEASDDIYWRRHADRCEWRSLGDIIEYSPDFLTVPDKRAGPVFLIAVRSTLNRDLEHVTFKVKAKKAGTIYQQEIMHRHLCGMPVRKALTAIPLKPKSPKGVDWHKLGDIYIKLVEAVDSDGVDLAKGKKVADFFPSTSTDSASHSQVERWGQYWNTDAINLEKEDIKTRYYQDLVQSARKLGRPLTMRRTAYRLLTGRIGVALTFWSQNLWKAEGIRHSIALAEANDRQNRSESGRHAAASRDTAHPATSVGVGS